MTSIKKNKKGQATAQLFTMIVFGFVFIILLGAFLYMFGIVDESLSGNIIAGAVNLSNASSSTVGAINQGLINSADFMGIMFMGGLILMVMLTGYFSREKTLKVFFFLEFIVIILAYIVSVYIANEWESLLTILPFADLLIANAPKTSSLMLLLPRITLATGFVTLVLTYAGMPQRKEEEVAGF